MTLIDRIHRAIFITVLLSSLFSSSQGFAAITAKVILLRGKVEVERPGSTKALPLKQGDLVYEKSKIKTSSKSFVKLKQGENSLSLGPDSEMLISRFPESEAGAITLLKGQVRSQINKGSDTHKVKLLVKTPSAAMGVRGTEFQVIYNQTQSITSLITFSGEVDMAPHQGAVNMKNLENIFTAQKTVKVVQGQYSGTIPGKQVVSLPVKISPAQFSGLKRNDTLVSSGDKQKGEAGSQKKYRSPIPSKALARSFVSDSEGLKTQITSNITIQSPPAEINASAFKVPPEGMNDSKRQMFAPPAGGLIDMKTGLYVPPPPGSQFDANTQVYLPPQNMGGIDVKTGEYIPPAGHELKADGTFVATSSKTSKLNVKLNSGPRLMKLNEYGDNFMKAQVNPGVTEGRSDLKRDNYLGGLPEAELARIQQNLERSIKNNDQQNRLLQKSQASVHVHLK